MKSNVSYVPQPGPESGEDDEGFEHQGMLHHTHAYDDDEKVPGIRDLHDEKHCTGHQTGSFHKGR
jgi:hypothetical protein